eukprot:jgi/Tetstr1/437711/TSEL_026366.t1
MVLNQHCFLRRLRAIRQQQGYACSRVQQQQQPKRQRRLQERRKTLCPAHTPPCCHPQTDRHGTQKASGDSARISAMREFSDPTKLERSASHGLPCRSQGLHMQSTRRVRSCAGLREHLARGWNKTFCHGQ